MWICLICTLLTVYKRPIVIPIIMIQVPSMSDMIIDGAIFRMGLYPGLIEQWYDRCGLTRRNLIDIEGWRARLSRLPYSRTGNLSGSASSFIGRQSAKVPGPLYCPISILFGSKRRSLDFFHFRSRGMKKKLALSAELNSFVNVFAQALLRVRMGPVFVGASCPNKPDVGTMAVNDSEGRQGYTHSKFRCSWDCGNGHTIPTRVILHFVHMHVYH